MSLIIIGAVAFVVSLLTLFTGFGLGIVTYENQARL